MTDLEKNRAKYLFKIKKHKKVKELIYRVHDQGSWTFFKERWEAKEATLDFSRSRENRRVVIVLRKIHKDSTVLLEDSSNQFSSLWILSKSPII